MTGARRATCTRSSRFGQHKPPTCDHDDWRFAGSDSKRGASEWRCPTGKCQPASVWVKASRLHPLVPRETLRFSARVRGLDRVRLHADLTILAKLACALGRAHAVPLAA